MIPIGKIREYIMCPQFGDKEYGAWGGLRLDQRQAYKDLIDIIEGMEIEIERLKRQIKIKDEWCDRIWEIGTDYDGYGNDLEELKNLVDELVEYSNKAKKCDDKCVAYISYENGKEIKENILMEELGSDKE